MKEIIKILNYCKIGIFVHTFAIFTNINICFTGKDSPASKLLFAKDIPLYRQLVLEYYADIQQLPQVQNYLKINIKKLLKADIIFEKEKKVPLQMAKLTWGDHTIL